jgi:hypothetical protein
MWLQSWKQLKSHTSFAFYCKCSAIVFFFTLCVLIVACGTSTNSQVDPGNQSVTVTIDLNGSNSSPTPPLPDYLCGAWVTNNSPGVNPDNSNSLISVFAKFVHTVNNNPVGVDGATATAQIDWPDGTTDTATAKTTPDGLAVIPIVLKPNSVNKIVLVQVTFTKDGIPPCQVPQPAYFTPVLASPTATQPSPQPTGPSITPTIFITPRPRPSVTPIKGTTPGPTPSPGP